MFEYSGYGALVCALALSACNNSGTAAASGGDAAASVAAATAVAQSWLALVDKGKYADSWSAAAKPFQSAISQDGWLKAAGSVRIPLGSVLSRQVSSAQYTTTVPGAPDGKYVIIQFGTAFEKKPQAVETVTPMLEADGTWRVSGYFVK